MHIPAIGHTFARSFMPQIDDISDFLSSLKEKGVASSLKTLNPHELKSTQLDFDANKVFNMMQDKGERKPIITSNDGYVLDGHHRWLEAANKNEKVDAHVCDCPILDLLHYAKRYAHQSIGLNEDIDHTKFGPMLDAFVSFASDQLGIKSLPNIRYKDDRDNYNSFAAYHPGHKEVSISVSDRHPMDIFRSLAHELVHHSQNEYGRLYDGAGDTGSPIEDEANYMAGRIMRLYAKANPHMFCCKPIHEAIFVVGGPCSGKDRMARKLAEQYGYIESDVQTVINQNNIKDDIIINASADQLGLIEEAQIILEQVNGYSTTLLFVDTSNEISKLRNEERAAKGQRVLSEGLRFSKFETAQKNKIKLAELFEQDFHIIDNSIQEATSAKGTQNVNVKIKIDGPQDKPKKTASTKKATKTSGGVKKPKKTAEQIKMDMEAQKQRYTEKNEKLKQNFSVDSEERKMAHERETQAREFHTQHYQARAGEFQQKIETIRNAMMRLQPQGSNYKKVHGILKKQMAGALLGMRKYQKQSFDLHMAGKPPTPTQVNQAVNEQFKVMFEEGGAGEWGTDELRTNYQVQTPGQPVTNFKKKEELQPQEVSGDVIPQDVLGQTMPNGLPAWPGRGTGLGGYSGMAEHVQKWAMNEKTIERFKTRYGNLWEQKVYETAVFLNTQKIENKPRTLRMVQEAIDKGIGDMGTVPNQGNDEVKPVEEGGNDTFLNKQSKKTIKRKQ